MTIEVIGKFRASAQSLQARPNGPDLLTNAKKLINQAEFCKMLELMADKKFLINY